MHLIISQIRSVSECVLEGFSFRINSKLAIVKLFGNNVLIFWSNFR